jgi:hypothetical protein
MKVFGVPGGTLCTNLNYDQHHGASPISQGLIRTAIFIFEWRAKIRRRIS